MRENETDDTPFTRARNGFYMTRIRAGKHPVTGKSQQLRVTIATTDEAVYLRRLGRLREVSGALTAQGLTAEAKVAIQTAARQADDVRFELCCETALEHAPVVLARPKARPWATFGDIATAWTSGDLHRRFADQVKKKSDDDTAKDRNRLEYLCGLVVETEPKRKLGELPLARVTFQHASAAMEQLPADCKRPAARRQYAQLIGRVLKLAAFPCEVLAASPLKRGFLPKVPEGDVVYLHFYPDEDLRLMRCELVDYAERALFGTCNREGGRLGEFLRGLKWSGIDRKRNTISVGRRKGGRPGKWQAEPGTIEALEPLRALGGEGPFTHLPDDGKWSERLQTAMRLAELEREALYYSNVDEGFHRMRGHDTRATYVTLALAMKLNESHIMERTGHTTSKMVHRYDHAADAWQGGRLLPLDEALGGERPKGRAYGWVTGPNAELEALAAELDAKRPALPPPVLLLGPGDDEPVEPGGGHDGAAAQHGEGERAVTAPLARDSGPDDGEVTGGARPCRVGKLNGASPASAPTAGVVEASDGAGPDPRAALANQPGEGDGGGRVAGLDGRMGGREQQTQQGFRGFAGGFVDVGFHGAFEGETLSETASGFSGHCAELPDAESSMFCAVVAPAGLEPACLAAGDFKSRPSMQDGAREPVTTRLLVTESDENAHGVSLDRGQVRRENRVALGPDPVLVALLTAAHAAVDRGDAGAVTELMTAIERHRVGVAVTGSGVA